MEQQNYILNRMTRKNGSGAVTTVPSPHHFETFYDALTELTDIAIARMNGCKSMTQRVDNPSFVFELETVGPQEVCLQVTYTYVKRRENITDTYTITKK